MATDPAAVAAVSALLGAVLTKAIDAIIVRSGRLSEEATAIRAELRAEVTQSRQRIDALEAEVEELRTRLHQVQEERARMIASAAACAQGHCPLLGGSPP